MKEEPTMDSFFNPEDGILYTKVTGKVDFSLMAERMGNLGNTGLPRNLLILEDASKATAEFGIADLQRLMSRLEEIISNFEPVRHAVIHSDPAATAMASLAPHFRTSKKYVVAVFSTKEGAMRWLKPE